MAVDIQKASVWKRIAAWIFDVLLLCVLAVGFGALLSWLLGYDGYSQSLEAAYDRIESQYGVVFDISQEEYQAMTQAQRENYDAAYDALIRDEESMYFYNMVVNLSMLITTAGILAACMALEFAVPLLLKNGQTIGKKIFSLGVVRQDGVKINTMQLFVRTLLGKYTIETMVPVYLVMMLFWGMMDITGTLILAGLGVAQVILLFAHRNNAQIHDLLAGTVVVDISSQRIFTSTQELIEYTKRIHAERAARQDY